MNPLIKTNGFAPWVDLAWFPIVLALVKTLGARRAAPIAILGGYLFLPAYANWKFLDPLLFEKRTIPGLAILIAALIFDRRPILQARPSWLDLPMVGFVINPLVGLIAHRFDQVSGSIDQAWVNLTEWALPYLIARVYLGDPEGPRRLAGAIVIGGLVYVPICLYETAVGPGYYLSGLVYGTQYYESVHRLGGFRPEGFFGIGLELATWMALTTIMATWLALSSSGWRLFKLPTWTNSLVAVIIGITSLLCRGVYGYLEMALGLGATAITLGLRTKWLLIVLLLVPPTYLITRGTQLWSGRELSKVAGLTGRESTVGLRLYAENLFVKETVARDPSFGFGGRAPYWDSDGWWVSTFKGGGLVGLVTQYSAFLFPCFLVVFASRRRFPARSVEVGLALIVMVAMIDSLHNTSMVAAIPMIGGALVSSFLDGGPTARLGKASQVDPPRYPSGQTLKPVAMIVTVLILTVVEILGRLPRSHPSEFLHAKPLEPSTETKAPEQP